MSTGIADQSTSVKEFSSPLRVLVAFFRKSRDQWKQKYMEAKTELKRFKVRVSDVSKSRDAWKEKSEARHRELEALQAQVQQLQAQLQEASSEGSAKTQKKMKLPTEADWSHCPQIAR